MTTQLPPQGPREPDEMLPGEAELAALYRQLPHSEPSPALDAAVLRAAAHALAPDEESPTVLRERRKAERERGDWVHPKPIASSATVSPSIGGSRRPRWLIALGTAASLVLAAGLAWHMREPPPTTSTSVAADSAAPAQAMKVAALPSAKTPAAAMQPTEAAPPPPSEAAKQPPLKRTFAQSRPEPAADTSRKAAADESTERASSKTGLTGNLRRTVPAAAPAPPAALQEVSANAVEAAPETTATMAAAPPAPSVDGTTAATTGDTAAQELGKIRQLFKQGRDGEARQRLTAFQRAHPQWNLPPELRAQLRKP
jgi:hypothetical protein